MTNLNPTPLPPLGVTPSPLGGPKKHTLLDGIITGLFGSDTKEMTPEEGAQVENQRKAAGQKAVEAAYQARKNPGMAEIAGPEASGAMSGGKGGGIIGDLIKSVLSSILKV